MVFLRKNNITIFQFDLNKKVKIKIFFCMIIFIENINNKNRF